MSTLLHISNTYNVLYINKNGKQTQQIIACNIVINFLGNLNRNSVYYRSLQKFSEGFQSTLLIRVAL